MNKRIRELAEQAGFVMWSDCDWKPRGEVIDWASNYDDEIERFAELVRADEREACANVCEDLIGTRAMARHCADAIRARDDIYDIWVEQGTRQENRQVAPSDFECPRCGHCCHLDSNVPQS